MKTKTVTVLAAAVALALGVVQFGRAAAGGLQPPDPGNVRIEGRIGEKLSRCLDSRVYSGWARGPSYDEAENAFRTHADDADGNTGWQNEYWGATYAGTDSTAWQHTAKCGSFAADKQVARFETPSLSSEIVYVRFYTPDGFWSQTVYLPDLERQRSGMVLLLK